MLVGDLGKIGLKSFYYWGVGSMLISTCYFIKTKEWTRRNPGGILDNNPNKRKVLLMKWNNDFDWKALGFLTFFAIYEMFMISSIILTMQVAHQAGLNNGIAIAIWSINPFFVALVERIGFNVNLNISQFLGMLALMTMAILVSLSDLFSPKAETLIGEEFASVIDDGTKKPVWLALLTSLAPPVLMTGFSQIVKYADKVLKLDPVDFAMAYWFIDSVLMIIMSLIHFNTGSGAGTFEWKYWFMGFFGSMLSLIGCTSTISAFNVENPPFGPISALLQTQSIINVVIYALRTQTIPSTIEIIGLIIGFMGAMILTIPNEMYSLWFRLTRCRAYREENKINDDVSSRASISSAGGFIATKN